MRDRLIPLILFVVVSSVYYATATGLTSSNDGSHYALLRSMVDESRWRIETFAHHAEGNDLSIRDEVIYSDRPPGTAILAAPWYVVGRVLLPPIRPMYARYDAGHPPLAYLMMFPAMIGAAVVVLIYWMLRHAYRLSLFAALLVSFVLAFGTTLWKYGSVLYSHAPSALLITSGVALPIWIVRERSIRIVPGLLLGLALGASVVVEYSNAIFVMLALAYVALGLRRPLVREPLPAVPVGVGLALPIVFLMIYNTVNFGGPLTTSYEYAINYPWAASFATTFDVPLMRGLAGVMWYGIDFAEQENQGIVLLMPVLLVGLGGVWAYIRQRRGEAIFVLGVFAAYLLLFAKHHTFSGFTADTRYLTPFLSLWAIPMAFAIETLRERGKVDAHRAYSSVVYAVAWMVVYGLLFLSVRNIAAHIGFSYSYVLDPAQLQPRASTPENWAMIFGSVFPNWQNLPLIWGVEIMLVLIGAVAGRWSASRRRLAPPATLPTTRTHGGSLGDEDRL